MQQITLTLSSGKRKPNQTKQKMKTIADNLDQDYNVDKRIKLIDDKQIFNY